MPLLHIVGGVMVEPGMCQCRFVIWIRSSQFTLSDKAVIPGPRAKWLGLPQPGRLVFGGLEKYSAGPYYWVINANSAPV
jgi:hypothetical protein